MDRNKRRTNRGHQTAGEMAHTIARTVEGASFTAGASALVVVLARWLAERGERPVHDAEVYATTLKTVVRCMSCEATQKGGRRAPLECPATDSREVPPLLLKAGEVAKLLGLGRTKVYEMMNAGSLPVVRLGTAVRVPRRELLDWIEANTQKAA